MIFLSKVCFVCDTLPFTHKGFSGAEICCEYVAGLQEKKGDEVFFISSNRDFDTKKKVYDLPKSHSKNLLLDPHIILKLYLILRKEKPDVIHLFTKKYLIASVLAGRLLDIRIIYSVVDYHILCKNNILKRGDGSLCTGRKGFFCRFRQIWFNWIIDRVDSFWTFTDTSKDRMVSWGIPSDKIKVFYQYSMPSVEGKESLDHPAIVFVGSVHPHKGIDVVIRSMEYVTRRFPAAHLYLIGGGRGEYISQMKDLVSFLNLQDNVFFCGSKSHSDTIRFLKGADVSVVAEQWYSDFGPIVLFESVSLGVPTVSGDLGASGEFTDNIVEYDVPVAYGERIIEVLNRGFNN